MRLTIRRSITLKIITIMRTKNENIYNGNENKKKKGTLSSQWRPVEPLVEHDRRLQKTLKEAFKKTTT